MVPTEEYYSDLMTVNDYLDQEKMKSQSNIAMAWLNRHNEYLDNMSTVYNSGSQTDMLGKTFTGICQQCDGYVSVIDVLKSANECDYADHEYMLAVLGTMTFDGSAIIPAAIEAHRNEDDERAAAASDRNAALCAQDDLIRSMYYSSAVNHENAADTYKEEWERLEKYMRRFHRVDEKTKDLFKLGNEYRVLARNGLNSIAWTYNSDIKEYSLSDDSWKNDKKKLDEKVYEAYISHAKEIGESWSLEDACKIVQKDVNEVSAQEYMALCYAFDGMTEEEMSTFIDSAYKKVKYWPPQRVDYAYGGMYTKGYIQYELTGTFSNFARIYYTINNANCGCYDNGKLFRANVLYLVDELNSDLYMPTDTENCKKNLGISVKYDEDNKYGKLTIGTNCNMGVINNPQEYRINQYSDKLTGDINITIKDDLKVDDDVSQQLIVQAVQTGLDKVPGVGEVLTGVDFLQTYLDNKMAVEKYEKDQKWLNISEAMQDLDISATVINRRDEDHYGLYFTNVTYKNNYIQEKIDIWNTNHTDKQITCSPNELVLCVLGKSDAVEENILCDFIEYI